MSMRALRARERRAFAASVLAVLLFCLARPVSAEETPAENLSLRCEYGFSYSFNVRDAYTTTYLTFPAHAVLPVSWAETVPVRYAYVAFTHDPVPFTLLEYGADGALLGSTEGVQALDWAYPLAEGCRSLELVAGDTAMSLTSLYMYGEGAVPDFHPFTLPEGKLDYMVVATHADDDVLFLGAVPPIYGAERGKAGTVVYLAVSARVRMDEALNGAWAMGIRIHPLFTAFQDVQKPSDRAFPRSGITLYLVRQFRRLRPDVVVAQDVKGEYGHWEHVTGSAAVQDAVRLAADPAFDPDSAARYGAWQVKKLYQHLYPENTLTLDIHAPLAAMGGRSALEVARDAFRCHRSQSGSRHAGRTDGVYDPSAFGLVFTAVGADTPGVNDMFEHIG